MGANVCAVPWITELLEQTGRHTILSGFLVVIALATSFAIALAVLVRLPSDYLCASRAEDARRTDGTAGFWAWRISRNLLGAILVVVGAVLSLPAIPGQGLITVLAGILLLDFPGRVRLLRKTLGRPLLLRSINRLRAKFSHPPLIVD